jgi:hypothetical protein
LNWLHGLAGKRMIAFDLRQRTVHGFVYELLSCYRVPCAASSVWIPALCLSVVLWVSHARPPCGDKFWNDCHCGGRLEIRTIHVSGHTCGEENLTSWVAFTATWTLPMRLSIEILPDFTHVWFICGVSVMLLWIHDEHGPPFSRGGQRIAVRHSDLLNARWMDGPCARDLPSQLGTHPEHGAAALCCG